jgi:hypothetical protein
MAKLLKKTNALFKVLKTVDKTIPFRYDSTLNKEKGFSWLVYGGHRKS